MGPNTSKYTQESVIPVVMRDYPWNTLPTTAQLELDIPIELSLWGVLGIFMFIFTKIAAFGLASVETQTLQPDLETGEMPKFQFGMIGMNGENPNGIFLTDVGFYMLNGSAYVADAVLDIVITIFGLTFYATRVQMYNDITLPKYSYTMLWDIAAIVIFTFGLLIQIYKGFVGVITIQDYVGLGFTPLKQQFLDIGMFQKYVDDTADNYTEQVASFIGQSFFGPAQVSTLMDTVYVLLYTASGQYGGMIYYGLPLIFNFLWNFVVITLFPWLGLPHINYEQWSSDTSMQKAQTNITIYVDKQGNLVTPTIQSLKLKNEAGI